MKGKGGGERKMDEQFQKLRKIERKEYEIKKLRMPKRKKVIQDGIQMRRSMKARKDKTNGGG